MTVCHVLVLAAALVSAAPKAEVRNVRISTPKLTVSRAKSTSNAVVTGQFHIDMSFARATAKTPGVRLTAVCEQDGALVAYNAFLDKPNTNTAMKRGDIMGAFRSAGIEIPTKEREQAYSDPTRFTTLLPEVSKDAYSSAVYGTSESDRGFFRLGKCVSPPKIVVYRIEVWQNGVMAASWESSKTGLGKYGLPDDWHAWRKHPQKFKYVDVR